MPGLRARRSNSPPLTRHAMSLPGPISDFLREVGFVYQTTNLSPNRMANWVLALHHSRGGCSLSSTARFCPSYSRFIAASSPGKRLRVRTARRSFESKASFALLPFQEAKPMEQRIRCTTQVRAAVWANTALIAYGNPRRPSTTAVKHLRYPDS
jgi:hypothetical protein